MSLHIGKKLYYHNQLYWPVFCSIVEINSTTIIVESESNRRMEVPIAWVNEKRNYIKRPDDAPKEEAKFFACPCGSMRFRFEEDKLICADCNAEYNKEDMGLLNLTNYVPCEIKEIKTIH